MTLTPRPVEAAATSVPVTLEEMDKVIRRGFRAMHPKQSKASWGEVLYTLTPDDDDPQFVIRVQTSIFQGDMARGEGEDSMRVTLLNEKTNKPIAAAAARVHRTQNWKDNLRKRIEDAIETFEDMIEDRQKIKEREKVRAERQRQGQMLDALANQEERSGRPGPFSDMMNRMFSNKNMLLSPKQLAWVESTYARLR